MSFFVREQEREGTCYHEFYRGAWDENTFWKEDSLFLHDDILCENKGFWEAIVEVIPEYDPYGDTRVSFEAWKKIGEVICRKDHGGKELYEEADAWMKDACRRCGCVTILGV